MKGVFGMKNVIAANALRNYVVKQLINLGYNFRTLPLDLEDFERCMYEEEIIEEIEALGYSVEKQDDQGTYIVKVPYTVDEPEKIRRLASFIQEQVKDEEAVLLDLSDFGLHPAAIIMTVSYMGFMCEMSSYNGKYWIIKSK